MRRQKRTGRKGRKCMMEGWKGGVMKEENRNMVRKREKKEKKCGTIEKRND